MKLEVTKSQLKEVVYDAIDKKLVNNDSEEEKEISYTFWDGLNKIFEEKKSSSDYSISTIKKDKTLVNHLSKFFKHKHKKYDWQDLDTTFFDEFSKFLITKQKLTNPSALKLLVMLKTALNRAVKNGYSDNYNYLKAFDEVKQKLKVSNDDHINALLLPFELLNSIGCGVKILPYPPFCSIFR